MKFAGKAHARGGLSRIARAGLHIGPAEVRHRRRKVLFGQAGVIAEADDAEAETALG
jgi:hypothetical protein